VMVTSSRTLTVAAAAPKLRSLLVAQTPMALFVRVPPCTVIVAVVGVFHRSMPKWAPGALLLTAVAARASWVGKICRPPLVALAAASAVMVLLEIVHGEAAW